MLVNFAQSQKIERAACERALPAGVKDTPDGASVRCCAESSDQYRTITMMAMTMIAAISESARSNAFERVPAKGHFERRHDIIYFRGLPRLAEINSSQSAVLRSRPAFLSASVRCAPGGISRASSRASIALALLTAIIGRDHAFQPFAHGSYWGGLSSPAKPLANAGFHWVLRYGRGLNTTAPLALKCSAVEASGSRLDLGEKHSLVIARRAARPLNRREVGRGDRLIFAHGASLRWERYELPVTDNWSILLIFHNLCLAGLGRDARRWRRPKRGVGRRLTGYTPTACPLKRHMADCERGLLVLAERRHRL